MSSLVFVNFFFVWVIFGTSLYKKPNVEAEYKTDQEECRTDVHFQGKSKINYNSIKR